MAEQCEKSPQIKMGMHWATFAQIQTVGQGAIASHKNGRALRISFPVTNGRTLGNSFKNIKHHIICE
jgi:hypothetical protein